jgi:hypothetical protein
MIFFTIVPILAIWWKTTEEAPISFIQKEIKEPSKPAPKQHPVIRSINERNAKIKTFSSSDIVVKVWQNGMRFKLSGNMYYEKDLNFRMKFRSIFGKEVDLGANEELFWYWSRRDERKGLHYATYEDYNRTRLKTPFNPIFIRESLGLGQIKTKDAYVTETEKNIVIISQFKNSIGKTVLRYTFIEKANQKFIGSLITDKEGNPIAIAEILEYNGDVPKSVLYTWYAENKILYLDFVDPQFNTQIDESNWQMPNIKPQINMGEE